MASKFTDNRQQNDAHSFTADQDGNAARNVVDNKTHDLLTDIADQLGAVGTQTLLYNEISAAVPASTSTVLTYTVPVGKTLEITSGTISGDNISKYTVEVNSSVVNTKRSTWTKFNVDFDIINYELSAGDTLTIKAENKGDSNSDYEATLIGVLK